MNPTLDLADLDGWIGRLFMAGMPGTFLDAGTEGLIRETGLGGVILFSRNIESPLQLFSLCRDLQEASMKARGTPLFLAVDQEGGRVSRLPPPFTQSEGNEAMGADERAVERVRAFAEITAREMRLVGLNMNLAPVVDVPLAQAEEHLRGRTFGRDPGRVGFLGSTVVKVLQENGIMAVAKHFPGLGRATRDPHKDLPVIEADREEMESVHLAPFRETVKAGVSAVMTSHALYPALDPDHPATLSRAIVGGILRDRWGYGGLVITDDLEMGAMTQGCEPAEAALAAFEAGADILLVCSDQEQVRKGHRLLRERLLRGELGVDRLRTSLERILDAGSRFPSGAEALSEEAVRRYFRLGEGFKS